MQLAILLALALFLFLPLLMAWRAWPLNTELTGMRKFLATSAVLITSLAFLVFTALSIATVRKHGWFNNLSAFTVWLRIGFWTSLAGLFLSSFGKGRYRVWGIAASALLASLWLVIAWAPA